MVVNNPYRGFRLLKHNAVLPTFHSVVTLDTMKDTITYASFWMENSALPEGLTYTDIYPETSWNIVKMYEPAVAAEWLPRFTTPPSFDWRLAGIVDVYPALQLELERTRFRFVEGGPCYIYRGKLTLALRSEFLGGDEIDTFSFIEFPVGMKGELFPWRSRHPTTEPTRTYWPVRNRAASATAVFLSVFVPHKDARLDDCSIYFEASLDGLEPITNRRFDEVKLLDRTVDKPFDVASYVRVETPEGLVLAPDGTITIPVQVKWADGTNWSGPPLSLVAEATSGYLPHRRISIDGGGAGEFRLCALGVRAGESIKVKIGTRHYTTVNSLLIPVE
ncbi:hypothetical protein PQJ75_00660 [Rhodoplanes sp. TEM]|uniref:Uncharacterized protein n=1 Tax=Rhodoplanes tepidamans TaxID=200616 RepID=A0ABT5J5A7_RHOTP|nr:MULTISPECIES: hypothetical protein [Rhodoplanes]MDC7784763.1 hypothetical protein [Rhodoplanes tepidamans]MDC7982230.1 hypothetical protein [Rhodoplanes sp. TEM]MDQ0356237.1 hypothetical protein [Rhodoplanes tepidamans]